jgi:hypothetical protein
VVGVGVDLSVATVETLSAISGAKYISVVNADEFMKTVADEFAHDVTPVSCNAVFWGIVPIGELNHLNVFFCLYFLDCFRH